MKMDILNSELITAMRAALPEGANLANTLMDMLFLGKEAIYRRLRGEVPFTLTEAAVISQEMGISLDRLVGSRKRDNAVFDLNLVQLSDPIETYYSIISHYVSVLGLIRDEDVSELATASNIIPQAFLLKYEALSRFRIFKWIYQQDQVNFVRTFGELNVPEKLLSRQKEFVIGSQYFQQATYIWDNNIFQNLITDIRYFTTLGLVTEEEVRLMKSELLQLLDELEDIARKGQFKSGRKVNIYISNINSEATYSYVDAVGIHISLIRVFSINSITSYDDKLFYYLKEWIRTLRKFSTQISESGELFRNRFFNRQRELVKNL